MHVLPIAVDHSGSLQGFVVFSGKISRKTKHVMFVMVMYCIGAECSFLEREHVVVMGKGEFIQSRFIPWPKP
jgi:hypothetical protein